MPLFSIPLSGLSSNSDALSVISNNLANLNTVGYKGQSVTFRDLFYQSLGNTGGGDPIQIGAGAAISSISSNFTDGNLQSTGVSTDVAIQGEGFFITDNVGTTQYTRGGHFKIADDGYLTTQDGQYVMGYPAAAGSVASNQTLSHIQLNRGQTSPPSATSRVQMTLNLNSGTLAGNNYSVPLTVYDSLGNTHVLQFNFAKTGANNWDYSVSIPTSDLSGTAAWDSNIKYNTGDIVASGGNTFMALADNTNVATSTAATWKQIDYSATTAYGVGDIVEYNGAYYQASVGNTGHAPDSVAGKGEWAAVSVNNVKLTTGSLSFRGDGRLTSPTDDITGISLPGSVSFANGASAMKFDWTIMDTTGNPLLSQTAATSAPSQSYQNGYGSGTLSDFSIGADGTIEGKFSNGQTMTVAQIALARFANVQGLNRAGSNCYTATLASGEAVVGIPQAGGRGKLSGSNLEMSNVDMSKEFSSLIVTQRGFQANAKVITTFDEVTQATINLKQ